MPEAECSVHSMLNTNWGIHHTCTKCANHYENEKLTRKQCIKCNETEGWYLTYSPSRKYKICLNRCPIYG